MVCVCGVRGVCEWERSMTQTDQKPSHAWPPTLTIPLYSLCWMVLVHLSGFTIYPPLTWSCPGKLTFYGYHQWVSMPFETPSGFGQWKALADVLKLEESEVVAMGWLPCYESQVPARWLLYATLSGF